MLEYVVDLYYSGYATVIVDAENEDDAVEKARATPHEVDYSTLERWKEADTAHTCFLENE